MDHTMKFSCNDHNEADFKEDGLRPFFKYRDLGIRDATNGRVVAHVIRAIPGKHCEPQRHHHEVEFQMVYILKGWMEFEYEGVGKKRLTAGTCVHQPPGIRHTELAHSDDLELIEIVMPGDFKTVDD
ncbi:MAG TPA: cupin domain-containing protein [Burkholderiales bacterium]|nr:cupin domain-containing protein [Burkholderiales bacterium]